MDWTSSVIWWHCYPLRFVGAEERAITTTEHRFDHLANWLDHAQQLGCDGLLLAPVFDSVSHGYDTLDYYRIDPRLGDDADFDEFMRQAKVRGMRVVLDGVFNHVSREHEIVRRALAAGEDSPEGRWLKWDAGFPYCFEGNLDLVELNLAHPPVADYIADVMIHWLDRGADGWRLDAAFAPGADVWRPILDRVRAVHPDVWILAELLTTDYLDFAARAGVDSVTQYELWKGIWSSLKEQNLHELAWSLKRHVTFVEQFRPQTFIGNHDVTRIRSNVGDDRHLGHAVALLMTLPGIPSVYAGDEFGFTGVKEDRPGGDDAMRPAFPRTPDELADAMPELQEVYRRLIAFRRRHPWLVDATVSTRDVTNTFMVVELTHRAERLELVLNLGDDAAPLPAGDVVLAGDASGEPGLVGAHDWAIVRPEHHQVT
ncbi:MAG: DUF3459 domain-containing protein [Actinomycetales bacterium]|nr:DUF3459 domain-containing protein [Actinomycetales bacterium]